jgi:KUP system potassium uptake protein
MHGEPQGHGPATKLSTLTLAALGVVYGDIGTSPLYTMKECTSGEHGAAPTPANVLGVLSLIVWSLTMVVAFKYLLFIVRADNRGEGGILALLALVPASLKPKRPTAVGWVSVLVLIGAALLYGDGIITPAISVLSAVEGLEVATTSLKDAVIPLTCLILVFLFSIQRRGTANVGKYFGPVMVVWFLTLAVLGIVQLVQNPIVLQALSPHHAVAFFQHNGKHGFFILGSVVLAVTGGEALYADMGHFGVKAIRTGWFLVAMPALLLNYLGQGALILRDPAAIAHPFYGMVPKGGATYALVTISAFATVIASQALISGAFSLTSQAVQLGYFPRVTVKHTSHEAEGQIYIPQINWMLMVACVLLVLGFQQSSKLAAAYGIAVTGTMAITSIIFYVVTRGAWGWSRLKAGSLVLSFLIFDVAFFGANIVKFVEGGWFPIFVGAGFFACMLTWKIGRGHLANWFRTHSLPMDEFLASLSARLHSRVPGIGVVMASNSDRVPPILVHHAQRIHVLPEIVVLFTAATAHVPFVEEEKRLETELIGSGFYRVIAHCGFMEQPDVPRLVAEGLARFDLASKPEDITYYLGRETFLATGEGKMGRWSESLFAFLSRNAQPATTYFGIPSDQVVELGTQIDL